MHFIPADLASTAIFCVFAALMFALIVYAVWKTKYRLSRFLTLFLGYLAVFCIIVAAGLPERIPLPTIPLLFLSVMAGAAALAFSNYGLKIAQTFPIAALLGFQAFRLPLELILHHWAELGTVPPTMTWTGQNWDIVTGIVSLVAIPFVSRNRGLAWAVQGIGFLLLMNVLRVVIMSSPFPFAWPLENPILLIAYLPYALIGPLFVGAALAGHLIAFRALAFTPRV